MLYNDRNTTTILATLTKEREDKYMERILCLATWIVFFLAIKNVVTFNIAGLIICLIVQIVLKAKIRKIRKEKKK